MNFSHVKFLSNNVEVAWPVDATICDVIFICILLTSKQMNFLMQFEISKKSFQRLQIALNLRARAIFCTL